MPSAPCATLSSPNTRPLVYSFPEAGTFAVSGTYRHGNDTVTASVQVRVVDFAFSGEAPACLVGRERPWTVTLPQGAVLEPDPTITLNVLGSTPITNNQSQITVSLLASTENGPHALVARLYEGGPILAATKPHPFWVRNAVDRYFWTVERYADSELWEVNALAKNVPASVQMQIKVFIGGVTFDDYTLERWITREAFNAVGEYNFRLFHPNSESSSTCHTFKLYQDGVLLGEAL
jgi:hypothetical protein